jgi:hypothetical protein
VKTGDRQVNMAGVSRLPIAIVAGISGIATALAVLISTYTFAVTPTIDSIPINTGVGSSRNESKFVYLYFGPVVQLFIFVVLAYYAIRWDTFQANANRRINDYKARFPDMRNVEFSSLMFWTLAFFLIFELGLLFWSGERCLTLIESISTTTR